MGSDTLLGCPARERTARTLEAALGPAEGRYFAAGYRSVRYDLKHVRRASSTAHGLDATGVVTYPARWSLDASGNERVPHLSSVDAIVLPILALEEKPPEDLRGELGQYRVRSIDLRSGSKPWLGLAEIPITEETEVSDTCLNLSALVGNIHSQITLLHDAPAGPVPPFPSTRARPDEPSVYGGLFQTSTCRSLITAFDTSSAILHASHAFAATVPEAATSPFGVESGYWPAPTVVDYLVTMGQLTQALLYEITGSDRARIGSLWMRTMRITHDHAPAPSPLTFRSKTRLLRDREIPRGEERIHDVLVESLASNGVHARATLAYTEGARI